MRSDTWATRPRGADHRASPPPARYTAHARRPAGGCRRPTRVPIASGMQRVTRVRGGGLFAAQLSQAGTVAAAYRSPDGPLPFRRVTFSPAILTRACLPHVPPNPVSACTPSFLSRCASGPTSAHATPDPSRPTSAPGSARRLAAAHALLPRARAPGLRTYPALAWRHHARPAPCARPTDSRATGDRTPYNRAHAGDRAPR